MAVGNAGMVAQAAMDFSFFGKFPFCPAPCCHAIKHAYVALAVLLRHADIAKAFTVYAVACASGMQEG